jgi:hypothetical protein
MNVTCISGAKNQDGYHDSPLAVKISFPAIMKMLKTDSIYNSLL